MYEVGQPKVEEALRRGDKRERTRKTLIDCAMAIVAEKGFEATSLEEVAQRAGMTRGAIYGNFKSRDDLFLAVAEAHWEPMAPPPNPGASLAEQLDVLAQMVIDALPQRRKKAVGAASFVAYALRHEPLRAKIAEANRRVYEAGASRLAAEIPPEELPLPPLDFVKACHAMIEGLFMLSALTPDLVDESMVRHAFQALGRPRESSSGV